MSSLLHELDNDAVLILYLADELPVEDRAELEQQLTVDEGLRAALARAGAGLAAAGVAVADTASGPSASAEAVALRRVGRAVRQWHAEQLAGRRTVALPERQPRFPTWAYPVAAAAALLVGTAAWWEWRAKPSAGHTAAETARADDILRGDVAWAQFYIPRARLVAEAFTPVGSNSGVADAEGQASSLARVDDPSDVPTLYRDGLGD